MIFIVKRERKTAVKEKRVKYKKEAQYKRKQVAYANDVNQQMRS